MLHVYSFALWTFPIWSPFHGFHKGETITSQQWFILVDDSILTKEQSELLMFFANIRIGGDAIDFFCQLTNLFRKTVRHVISVRQIFDLLLFAHDPYDRAYVLIELFVLNTCRWRKISKTQFFKGAILITEDAGHLLYFVPTNNPFAKFLSVVANIIFTFQRIEIK